MPGVSSLEVIYSGNKTFIFNTPVITAHAAGRRAVLGFDDVINALGRHTFKPGHIDSLFDNVAGFSAYVAIDGQVLMLRLMAREFISRIVFDSNSPRANEFKEHVFRILEEIDREGGYVVPGGGLKLVPTDSGPPAPISPIDALIAGLQQMKVMEQQLEATDRKATLALETAQGGPHFHTIAGWFGLHRIRVSQDIHQSAGSELAGICRSRGIGLPEKTSHGQHAVNRYPEDILREWWPKYLNRNPHLR